MKHGDKIKNLSRPKAHRDSLLRNLSNGLILNKKIVTTIAKAKALRVFIEPLITKTKKAIDPITTMHQHRIVFKYLHNKSAVKELFNTIGPKIANRNGGYTRIIKLGTRLGDNAEMAYIELVDFNEIYNPKQIESTTKKSTRRSRRKNKKNDEENNETPILNIEENNSESNPINPET